MNNHAPQPYDQNVVRPAKNKAAGHRARAAQRQVDPVLAELVKFLARAAAERDYEEHSRNKQKRRKPRSKGAARIPGTAS